MTEFTTLLQQGNAWFFIPSAILLGALHGLEPGHSKTMMAAFIIAIKGTIKQAVMLGLAATISHTAVVWLIAFGGMVISKRFTAQSAEPWLQLISAVIIIGTAFWMFWHTWRGERNWLENMHEYDHEHHHHDHEDHHDHGHHHHHHADEVFTSWGRETIKTYSREEISRILKTLEEDDTYGTVLRAKGMVAGADGEWIYFDMVPQEHEVRSGAAEYTGRICVIGSRLEEDKLEALFGLKK